MIFGSLITGTTSNLNSRISAGPGQYKARIKAVQLYSDQALVIRSGSVSLSPGLNRFAVRSLPAKLIDDAVRVRLPENGLARIKEIRVESIHQESFDSSKAREAETLLRGSEQKLRVLTDRYQSLKEEEQFLSNLRVGLPGKNKEKESNLPVHVAAWKSTLDFATRSLAHNHQRQIALQEKIDLAREELNVALVVADHYRSTRTHTQKEIHMVLESNKASSINLVLEYRVRGAAWYPVYAARVLTNPKSSSNKADVRLQTYALVRNETGENWSNARLSFSAADPQGSVNVPRLTSWRIIPVLRETTGNNSSVSSGDHAPNESAAIEIASENRATGINQEMKKEKARKPRPAKKMRRKVHRKLDRRDRNQQLSLQSNISRSNTYYQQNRKKILEGRAQIRSRRSEALMKEYKQNRLAQEQAVNSGNFQESLNRSEAILDNIRNVPAQYRSHFETERKRAIKVKAQSLRMLENQKLIRKLVSPRKSARGFDYRYRAPLRETIESDASFHKIYLGEKKLGAELSYETSPENGLHCFLIGRVRYTEDTPLLAGPVSVFHNSDYMGEADLQNINAGRPFALFLGSDESIRVSRIKHRFRETGGFLSKRYTYQNETEIKIRNLKKHSIKVSVYERLPYSSDDRIEISSISTSPGAVASDHKKVGLYRFEVKILPGKERKIRLQYKLSHDADVLPSFRQTGGPAW